MDVRNLTHEAIGATATWADRHAACARNASRAAGTKRMRTCHSRLM